MAADPPSDPVRLVGKHHAGGPRPAGSPRDTCPWCGSPSSGQYCEQCGFRIRRPFGALPDSQPATSAPQPQPAPQPATSAPQPQPEPQAAASVWDAASSWSSVPASPSPLDFPSAADSYSWSAHEAWTDVSSAEPTAPLPRLTPVTWSVVITPDRAYYDQMQAARIRTGWDLPFPAYHTGRRFPLTGDQVRIGRRSATRAVEPEIDLSEPPADPGVSRLHALLLRAPDGSWAVRDQGSANGTLLNGRDIPPGDLILLHDGDRINLGAWTAITVRRE